MKNKKIILIIGSFIIEVALPFIAIPVVPLLIKDCSITDSIIIGMGISIFIGVWILTRKIDNDYEKLDNDNEYIKDRINSNTRYLNKGFEEVRNNTSRLEYLLAFEKEITEIGNYYFRRQIYEALVEDLEKFKDVNNTLFSGYIETTPYSINTYGIEGIKSAKSKLSFVSSIKDYWERTEFTKDYLTVQYDLINNRAITIKRIFIGEYAHLLKLKPLMEEQSKQGIDVYYIDCDSDYCPNEWKTEDFLIQDDELLVLLEASSHKAGATETKEIITINKALVNPRIELFKNMIHNAKSFKNKPI